MNPVPFDECECGDYRHQHEGDLGHGDCTVCLGTCRQFRIWKEMVPTWRYAR